GQPETGAGAADGDGRGAREQPPGCRRTTADRERTAICEARRGRAGRAGDDVEEETTASGGTVSTGAGGVSRGTKSFARNSGDFALTSAGVVHYNSGS